MGVVNSYFVFQILDKLSPGIINGEGLQEEVHVCVCHYMHWYLLYLWDDRLRRFLSRKSKNCRPWKFDRWATQTMTSPVSTLHASQFLYFSPLLHSLLSPNQIITLIIRKHLSWLILWGNISGALIGLLSELLTLLVTYFIGDITQ